MVELKVVLHHGCLGNDHRSPGVVELEMKLHHGSPRVVKLVMRFTKDVTFGRKRYPRVVELVIELHHKRCKKVKFMVELHHGSSKECQASVGASPQRLPHPCEPVSGWLHKWD